MRRHQACCQKARELAKLINAIYSSSDLTDIDHMPQYRLHQLKGNKKDLYSLSIKEGYRIEFYPQDEQKNTLISGTNETEMFQKTKNIHIVAITKHYE